MNDYAVDHTAAAVRKSKAERTTMIFTLLIGVPILLFGVFRFFGEALPFEPYVVHEAYAIPDEACTSRGVKVWWSRTITKPFLGQVTFISITTQWTIGDEGDTPGPQTVGPVKFGGVYGDYNDPLPSKRLTPDRPGEWYLTGTVTVTGKVLGKERTQTLPYTSDEIFRVLPYNSPQCSR